MKNEKAFRRSQLIYEFGILMQPLEDLARAAQPPSLHDYRIAIAKVQAGDGAWRQKVTQLTTFAPDICFFQEDREIRRIPALCLSALNGIINHPVPYRDPNQLKIQVGAEVRNAQTKLFNYIDRVPIEWEPVVFEANTPFTSYLRIKESIVLVKNRLHYFDRYVKPDFFQLFLPSVDNAVSIRLVTTGGNARSGVAGVLAVSNLARQQFADYQLIEVDPADLHDRNLRVDDRIFSLGPGVDRAGMALTNFGPSDSSAEAHAEFDRLIASGRVVS
ncbi:MAG: hypothetical protein HOP29_09570 [Phycisphaerales bacterium]|nr:hypothetical protein [Phycisphaerales bacterium]